MAFVVNRSPKKVTKTNAEEEFSVRANSEKAVVPEG